ncbi:hypothetical protein BB561_001870 [Smittium simulii]|uniref:DH domain-containing protein n=1 Tax=Smittium simulii TaxID=133385 RepID=A0A2T9YSN2_9FUNG|nr:hypothetical protein BB561_001870 [Smittium simulii]
MYFYSHTNKKNSHEQKSEDKNKKQASICNSADFLSDNKKKSISTIETISASSGFDLNVEEISELKLKNTTLPKKDANISIKQQSEKFSPNEQRYLNRQSLSFFTSLTISNNKNSEQLKQYTEKLNEQEPQNLPKVKKMFNFISKDKKNSTQQEKIILENSSKLSEISQSQKTKKTLKPVVVQNSSFNKLRKTWKDQFSSEEIEKLALSSQEVLRQEVLYEIILTEKEYLRDLKIIIDEMEQRQKENAPFMTEIGDILAKWFVYFNIYRGFIVYQNKSLKSLERLKKSNAKFSEFYIESQKKPESRGLPLESFILIPFQRLLKYPLLLSNLARVTDNNSYKYDLLTGAINALNKEISVVQDAKEASDNSLWLENFEKQIKNLGKFRVFQKNRKFLGYGNTTFRAPIQLFKKFESWDQYMDKSKVYVSYPRDVSMWLFDDILIISKLFFNKRDDSKKQTYRAKKSLELIVSKPLKDCNKIGFSTKEPTFLQIEPTYIVSFEESSLNVKSLDNNAMGSKFDYFEAKPFNQPPANYLKGIVTWNKKDQIKQKALIHDQLNDDKNTQNLANKDDCGSSNTINSDSRALSTSVDSDLTNNETEIEKNELYDKDLASEPQKPKTSKIKGISFNFLENYTESDVSDFTDDVEDKLIDNKGKEASEAESVYSFQSSEGTKGYLSQHKIIETQAKQEGYNKKTKSKFKSLKFFDLSKKKESDSDCPSIPSVRVDNTGLSVGKTQEDLDKEEDTSVENNADKVDFLSSVNIYNEPIELTNSLRKDKTKTLEKFEFFKKSQGKLEKSDSVKEAKQTKVKIKRSASITNSIYSLRQILRNEPPS